MNITVVLPWPDRKLSPNASARHWRAKHETYVEFRETAFHEAQRQHPGFIVGKQRLSVIVTYYPPNKSRRDWDNVVSALKGSFDGVALGLGYNDSQIDVALTVRGKPKRGGEVVINILSVDKLKYSII